MELVTPNNRGKIQCNIFILECAANKNVSDIDNLNFLTTFGIPSCRISKLGPFLKSWESVDNEGLVLENSKFQNLTF